MPRKMSGIAISVIEASSVARSTARVAFDSAIHLYRSEFTHHDYTGNLYSLPVYTRAVVAQDEDIAGLAAELRVSLGQLIRRIRSEHAFPLGQGAVLGALDREGPRAISELAAAARVRPQSMAQTVRE